MNNKIAKSLLETKAFIFRPQNPFTWTSGIKSPVYCDNRMTLSFPTVRDLIIKGFVDKIKEQYPKVECIAGVATAGIPHAALIAHKLKLPLIYVRDKAKGHGKENKIEGNLIKKQKVVVIEDLISTGKSSIAAVKAVQDAGGVVLGTLAIFSYEFKKSFEVFEEAKIPFHTLTNFNALISQALKDNFICEKDLEYLYSWRKKHK